MTQGPTQTFTLPNGFTGPNGEIVREVELRKLNGYDEDLIRDKKNLRDGGVLDKLVKGCLTRLGTDTDPTTVGQSYDNFLWLADATYLVVMLRAWSISSEYSFSFTCPACEHMGRHRIDLLSLPVDDQLDDHRGRDKFEVLSGGDVVTFVPLLVKHSKLLETVRSQYKSEKGTRELLVQLKKIGDEECSSKSVKELTWQRRNELRQLMDSVSGGIDLELAMECAKCERVFKDNMPIEVKSFFFPTADTLQPMTAVPFRTYGKTSQSSEPGGDGDQKKSDG